MAAVAHNIVIKNYYVFLWIVDNLNNIATGMLLFIREKKMRQNKFNWFLRI